MTRVNSLCSRTIQYQCYHFWYQFGVGSKYDDTCCDWWRGVWRHRLYRYQPTVYSQVEPSWSAGSWGIHDDVMTWHYIDVIMTTIASQITSLTVVYSTVYSDADQRKHQRPASLAFVWGIHRDRWIPRTKGQLRGKCFHLMTSSWKYFARCWPFVRGIHRCFPVTKGQ